MRTLQEIITEADPVTRLLKEIQPNMVGYVNGTPLVITAILERTAVVHPLGLERNKFLVKLGVISVPEEKITWKNKSSDEQRIAKSTSIGRGVWKKIMHHENQQ